MLTATDPLIPESFQVSGWLRPTFGSSELEASYQSDRQRNITTWGLGVARTCAALSLLPIGVVVVVSGSFVQLACWLAAAVGALAWSIVLKMSPEEASSWYDVTAVTYTLFVMVVASVVGRSWCSVGPLSSVHSVALVSGLLNIAPQFMHISSVFYCLLLHVAVAAMLLHWALVHRFCGCSGNNAGNGTGGALQDSCAQAPHVTDRIGGMVAFYVLGLLGYVGVRQQELDHRRLYSLASPPAEEASFQPPAVVPSPTPGQPQVAKAKGGAPAKPPGAPAKKRDLTVPPPPLSHDEGRGSPSLPRDSKAPNSVLVRTMAGKAADWARIRRMAQRIQHADYDLKEFFDDCIASFPELGLFFAGKSRDGQHGGSWQASSGIAAEAEYQRTVGALFTVYWMLRLHLDGKVSFCYGVDDDWKLIEPELPADGTIKTAFSAMGVQEKRAKFYTQMDWKPFSDLVARSGCAPGAPGSTDRIVALLCLTSFHDIMKLPMLQPVVQPAHAPYNGYEAGVRIHDHDLALSYVLEHFPKLLPSYGGLDSAQQRAVLFTQGKMQFNHGWFVQAEAPPGGMLSTFKSVMEQGAQQADIDLYFFHWITDLAGAEATPLGGAEKLVLKFPQHVLSSFLWSMPYLSKLADMTETALVEQYLEARWAALVPNKPVPNDFTAIAMMRLVVMAQAEDPLAVTEAFRELRAADQSCLATEMGRTGCASQVYRRNIVVGGPAFLVYYAPALMQRNNKSKEQLVKALRTLCVVLRGARALWPMSTKMQGTTVILQVGELKSQDIDLISRNPDSESRAVWIVLKNNAQEGMVTLCQAGELNALCVDGSSFRVLDFTLEAKKDVKNDKPAEHKLALEPMEMRDRDFTTLAFKHSRRILVFTDMSTECDDECALLWLVAALNRRGLPIVVELVHTDSHVRLQWMAHILKDKFGPGGEWQLQDGATSFMAGNVLVNMYLAHSPENEERVINDLRKKAPDLQLAVETDARGKPTGVRLPGMLGGEDYSLVPGGPLDSIVLAAPISEVKPEFFRRFTACKCIYVVGTPGGINCPMPSWASILAAFHRLATVLYLTPDLTRTVRFPRSYVLTNVHWNAAIKRTVWDATVTFMARRPELPPAFGNWGLILRLNIANAMFCRSWYQDVKQAAVEDAPRPDRVVKMVEAYVERMSGYDRKPGAVLEELKNVGVQIALDGKDLDANGQPASAAAKETVRRVFRVELFKHVYACVLTTDSLLFQHKQNVRLGADESGFERTEPRCGYVDPMHSLADIFGPEDAIQLLQDLPLRRLTPAYDVVGMICADSALEEGTDIDGTLGLKIGPADEAMGSRLLTPEQLKASSHPLLMTLPQAGEGVYAVGPFG